MKKNNIEIIALLIILFAFMGCKNERPTCKIISPINSTEFSQGEIVTIAVDAEGTDGTITEVKFFINDLGVGTATDFPYTYKWETKDYTPDTYTIKARAIDDNFNQDEDEIEVVLLERLMLPTVKTVGINDITKTTAISGGNVTDNGGSLISARGVCWNTTDTPTINDNKTNNGTGIGNFTSEITGLSANTTYYVRAYAVNSQGEAYGDAVQFTTKSSDGGTGEKDNQTAVVDVTNPATGKTWMDRNLGATQAAISSTDEDAYGALYQWGRACDGHQKRNSLTTPNISSSNTPGHGNFIYTLDSPYDWRSPQNTELWQGINGINNPCPSGYRLPTIAEWEAEYSSWSSNDADGAFSSPLKLTVAGGRGHKTVSLILDDSKGYYWSSTLDGTYSKLLSFGEFGTGKPGGPRANGFSVRCIKD